MLDNGNLFSLIYNSDDSVEAYSKDQKTKTIDYYGTAMQIFPVAQADLISLEEKIKNNDNDFNIYGFKARTRRKTK